MLFYILRLIFLILIETLKLDFSYNYFAMLIYFQANHAIQCVTQCSCCTHLKHTFCRAPNPFTWCRTTKLCNTLYLILSGVINGRSARKAPSLARSVSLAMMQELSRSCVKCNIAWPTEIEGLNYDRIVIEN